MRKELGFLSEREKELFSQELASIEELEKAEQKASWGVVETELVTDPFSGFDFLSCPCAGGRGKRNDNKDNHIVGGLVVYQGVVQWCCCTTPAYDCKVKVACQVIVLSGLL